MRISKILTRAAFENAIRVNGAIGGSTNAVIHLLAMAGRVGVPLTLDDWDELGRDVPTLVDLKPSGRFLMEDFHYAGGLPAVIRTLGEAGLINREAMTVNGKTIWENCNDAPRWNAEVIRPIDKPLAASGGIAVLRGNLAPDGAVRQALRRLAAADEASRPRHRLRHDRALQGAHQRSGAGRRRRRACWCCGTAGRSDIRAWRKSATWACRRPC